MAVNMLGAEDGEPLAAEQQHDALKELANVVCGDLLPALAGDAAEFGLRPPLMVSGESPTGSSSEAIGYLMLDGGACRVRLQLDRLPPKGPDGLLAASENH